MLVSGALPLGAGMGAVKSTLPTSRTAAFVTDIRLPDLLHAVIARPPLPGWRLTGLDDAAALRMGRVAGVIRLEPANAAGIARLGGVAVLARDTWTALRGRDALRPIWKETVEIGDEPARSFFIPETAEPLMEPPSATVQAGAGRCAAWTHTHEPEALRKALAACLDLAPDAVTLHPPPSVCGQGASNPAYAVEAALLSRAMAGAPVSLTWTVADDLPFRRGSPWA
ncbi:hypothetical protein [Methylobacterium haplocladii]|uniref:Aldehyde oxidase/xanthine dehydrogenase a/b hammerhead domain-containing protein n=1 Tax=Methylobacterium haplocladii TaxID=1176176 RepID=A0A512ISK3_9HYPH|nr:hypothetical protein [Methylobacterium haplocladii]GEP00687.1 hypothetical protein MHA02_30740 [Methylobacterium haplocladii]GJD82379.1 Isoquinoline 1-oxidoreductase subunit beta [Methylobacterium haplocladii]GLS60791.1 hypothetical protein GCM10007887_34790 [Methylobacterium haplocladii]